MRLNFKNNNFFTNGIITEFILVAIKLSTKKLCETRLHNCDSKCAFQDGNSLYQRTSICKDAS